MSEFKHKIGSLVRLYGLNNAAYNGRLGKVIEVLELDTSGRWQNAILQQMSGCWVSRRTSSYFPLWHNPMSITYSLFYPIPYVHSPRYHRYCDRECQRNDWKRHTDECDRLSYRRQIAKSELISAAENGDLAEVRNLVQQGADVNESTSLTGWGPLHAAVVHGHLAVVRYLVQQGAEKEKASNSGTTPLMIAACFDHAEVVQ